MIKPNFAETAAFKDLSPAQQKAYIKAHPKSKFGRQSQHVSEENGYKQSHKRALKELNTGHAHMELHKDARANKDKKKADYHANKALRAFDKSKEHVQETENRYHNGSFEVGPHKSNFKKMGSLYSKLHNKVRRLPSY